MQALLGRRRGPLPPSLRAFRDPFPSALNFVPMEKEMPPFNRSRDKECVCINGHMGLSDGSGIINLA